MQMGSKRQAFKGIYKRTSGLLVMVAIVTLAMVVWSGYLNPLMDKSFLGKGNVLMVVMYAVETFVFVHALDGFKIGYRKGLEVAFSQVAGVLIADVLLWGQVLLAFGTVGHLREITVSILCLAATDIVCCVLLTLIFTWLYGRLFPPYRMLMVYGEHTNGLEGKVNSRGDKYQVCGEMSIGEGLTEVFRRMEGYDAVLLNDIPTEEKNRILKHCFDCSIRVYFTPKISDIIVKGSNEVDLFDSPLFLCKNMGLSSGQKAAKRAMDLVVSLLGLLITSPIFLVVALAIKLDDGGPVFFIQNRCTEGGRVFQMYKFRSMRVDAEADGKPHPAVDDDKRITPVGRFIRKTRIDELPQLINVLKGDMSLVGPRPERVEHVEKYSKAIPEFTYRLKVKGGLTGYAQVFGKYNTTAYDKLKMDLMYIVNYSFLLDVRILLLTLKVIFQRESTKGFDETDEGDPALELAGTELVGTEACGESDKE